ncbi:MAG TPA: lytic transglycosylase domain-containing protein [Verrucomicrobiae bacterium]|nr:lytic transglycosylase domain-containing protein [Verrucomicrobiae bacterium]
MAVFWAGGARGQTPAPADFDALAREVEVWMRENLDEGVLHIFNQVDRERVRELFAELNKSLGNDNVYDLAPLREGASRLQPLLEQFEETRPYASWLKTHFDYLDVADELRRKALPSPKSNPTPESQRGAWERRLDKRPLPGRAEKYVSRLKRLFIAQGVPGALVWMAEVESSFDPAARSPAGAVGMFQVMPATARSLGMTIEPTDERLDPDKSARAAARYVRYLYGRFKDWRLALAAYNCGETRVQQLLTRYKARSYAAIASRLPAETQMYIPKLEATLSKRESINLAGLRLPKE